jgi:hypothetical protein
LTYKVGVPNNGGMTEAEASEIIDFLDGTSAVAAIFGVKPPSVHEWRARGIPPDKLIRLAPILEKKPKSRWTRQSLFPNDFHLIWPELSGATKNDRRASERRAA